MTADELKDLYTEAVKIARAEKRMRLFVFRSQPDNLQAKIGEMDRLLYILEQMKDALKPHVTVEYEQPALIDVPRKAQYQ
jgi:hypothetical protein